MNPALASPAGTVIVLGVFTAELPLDRFTVKPPPGAAAVNVTVHASVPAPVILPLLHDSMLRVAGGAVPVPLRPITAVPLVVELLVTVSCPVAELSTAGSNCTFNLEVSPAAKVTARLLGPTTENDCPMRLTWVIVTGSELPFESRTVLLAV